MSSTSGVNNPQQPDPTSPDYWTTPGLAENGIDPVDSSDPTQSADPTQPTVDKDALLKQKADYEERLERMSQGNPGRADVEKHLQDIETQLSASDTGSTWGDDLAAPDGSDTEQDLTVVNAQYADDSIPTQIDAKSKTATYSPADDEMVTLHSNPGNSKVSTYDIKPAGSGTVSLSIALETKTDTAKVELVNGEYLIHVKGAKGEETYKIAADKLKTLQFQNSGDNTVDTSALKPVEAAMIQIGDNAPKWADQLLQNLPRKDDHNLQAATLLTDEIIKASKSGDWKGVKDFMNTNPTMMQPKEANDAVRKVLSSLVEPILSKEVEKANAPIQKYVTQNAWDKGVNPRDDGGAASFFTGNWLHGNFGGGQIGQGYMNWEDHYNSYVHIRNEIGGDVTLAKRVAIEFYADKLPPELKSQIVDTLKILPKDVRQYLLAGLTAEGGEKHMGDRFSTDDWSKLINASLAE